MRLSLRNLATLSAALVVAGALTARAQAPTSLFNGKDLSGWSGNPELWSVADGVIRGQTKGENPLKANTFLIYTNALPGDFELTCSYRVVGNNPQKQANSGIQYRSKVLDAAAWRVGGYQADIEAGDNYTGILYEEGMTRGIMALRGEKVGWSGPDCKKQVTGATTPAAEVQSAIKKEQWNEYRIVARGSKLQHYVNGKLSVEVADECEAKRSLNGVLALQLHVGPPMTVEFRDLKLKALP